MLNKYDLHYLKMLLNVIKINCIQLIYKFDINHWALFFIDLFIDLFIFYIKRDTSILDIAICFFFSIFL